MKELARWSSLRWRPRLAHLEGADMKRRDVRRRIAAGFAAAVLMVVVAAPAAAATPGGFTIRHSPANVVDKDGTVTLRIHYSCTGYGAPYDGTDRLIASITS